MTGQKDKKAGRGERRPSGIWRRTWFYILSGFVFLFLLLIIVSSNNGVQNWYSEKFTEFLSSKTGYQISMGITRASMLSGIEIHNLSIIDHQDSALFKAEIIQTSLRKNLFSLIFHNSINLEDLKIEGGELHIFTMPGDSISNLSRFISKLSVQNEKSDNCRTLDINKISLKRMSVEWAPIAGNTMDFTLSRGKLLFDKVNICDKNIELREIYLNGLATDITLDKKDESALSHGFLVDSNLISRDTFHFLVRHFQLDNSSLSFRNFAANQSPPTPNVIDFKNLDLSKIEFESRNIRFNNFFESTFSIDHASFKEKSGFVLKRMSVESGEISSQGLELNNSLVSSESSIILGDLNLDFDGYQSFKDFTNDVSLDGRFSDCKIVASDLHYFSPKLTELGFFREHTSNMIQISGNLWGQINSLKGKNIDLVLDKSTQFKGSFSSRNLTIPGEQLMNIRLESAYSTSQTISSLFPEVVFSPSFFRLGNLNFHGSFDGYFHDFVAFGKLNTSLGSMSMDMRLDLTAGFEQSEYSGNLTLTSFKLGEFAGNKEMGNISLSAQVRNGQGLDLKSAHADLGAQVESFQFRDHTYRNFVMDGYLDNNVFNGDFSISEEHIKMNLSGLINFGDSIPKFNFVADISHLDLNNLNITKNPLTVQSQLKIDLSGNNMDNLSGKFSAYNLSLDNLTKTIKLDSIVFSSRINDTGERYVDFSSEIISFYFDGKYSLLELPDALLSMVKKNFPKLSAPIKLFNKSLDDPPFYYDFYVYIPDSRTLFEILQPIPFTVKDLILSGHIDHNSEFIDVSANIDTLIAGNIKSSHFQADLNMEKDMGELVINVEKLTNKKMESDSVHFNALFRKNLISYNLQIDTLDKLLNTITLSAITSSHPEGFETKILNGSIKFLDDTWYFRNDNKIVHGNNYIALDNVELINNIYSLKLEDINENQGIKATISGFEMALLNPFLPGDKKLNFGGRLEGFVLVPEIFTNPVLEGEIRIPNVTVNDDPYGYLTALMTLDTMDENKLNFSGNLEDKIHSVNFTGSYLLKKRTLASHYAVKKFPIKFLEYLLVDLVSETQGSVTGSAQIYGQVEDLQIKGEGIINDVSTKINYLGTHYYANEQKAIISSNLIDLTGIVLSDSDGNTGVVTGGIKHTFFKNIELDLSLKSDKILALNTTRKENPSYYGTASGPVTARFTGPLQALDISINAEVLKGSKLTIPVRYETEVSQQSFIKFNSNQDTPVNSLKNKQNEPTGIDLEMNLSVRPGAEVKIILDERAGDNIQGKGTGDIRLEITRNGAFEMYGNYFIDEGTYLFTALTLIQKPFSIRGGGKITWTGDPLDATIDLKADYKGERVALDNFLKEYTVNNPLLAEKARKRTDVDLMLHLTGSLLHPTVGFDLNFPNLDGEIKSYAFSKLQKLRADQNLMYTQAVTLLSLGAFLPQDNLSGLVSNEGGVSTAATGIHTGLQYSAVLISKYLSGLFDELFANSSWISGIDIDFNVINSQSIVTGLEQYNIWPNEYTYDAKLHLFEDKASVELSGSYVNRGTVSERSYANGDFVFKYYFTEDRKLRIEAFSKREFDEFQKEWKWKIGTGLNYQLEFGSIYDLKKDVEKDLNGLGTPPGK